MELIVKLASVLSTGADHPVDRALACLLDEGGRPSTVCSSIREAVQRRNRFGAHAPPLPDDACAEHEAFLENVLDALLKGLQPLSSLRLVSVADIEALDPADRTVRYALSAHIGSSEHFPVLHESMDAWLHRSWCYLLGAPDGRPLSLAPFVFVETCKKCGRAEMFLAKGITVGPGSKVKGRGVLSEHEAEASVPQGGDLADLLEVDRAGPTTNGTGNGEP